MDLFEAESGRRGLKQLTESKHVATLVYKGPSVSLNKFYSQGHWGTRSAIKKKYRKIFDEIFSQSPSLKWMDQYFLVIYYNNRCDCDNITGMEKVFIDSLKHETDKETGDVTRQGYVMDDNKKYYRGMCIFPDENLPYNTVEFNLYEKKKEK
jgi:hypothetical protein